MTAIRVELQTKDGRVVYASTECLPEVGAEVLAEDGKSYVIASDPRRYPGYPYQMFAVREMEIACS